MPSKPTKKPVDVHQPKSVNVSEMKRIREENFISTYANNAHVLASQYDLSLLFGQIMVNPDGEPLLHEAASVTMTWEHAKRLRDVLTNVLDNYERTRHAMKQPDQPQ